MIKQKGEKSLHSMHLISFEDDKRLYAEIVSSIWQGRVKMPFFTRTIFVDLLGKLLLETKDSEHFLNGPNNSGHSFSDSQKYYYDVSILLNVKNYSKELTKSDSGSIWNVLTPLKDRNFIYYQEHEENSGNYLIEFNFDLFERELNIVFNPPIKITIEKAELKQSLIVYGNDKKEEVTKFIASL